MTFSVTDNLRPAQQHSLASLLAGRRNSDAVAIHWAGGALSYRQLVEQMDGVREFLRERGISAGDRVALALPNVPHMASIYYAILAEGAIVVPLNPLLSEPELDYHLKTAGSQLLFTWVGTRLATAADQLAEEGKLEADNIVALDATYTFPAAPANPREIEAVSANDPAVILFTSGTTGHPKGAVLTHKNLLSNAQSSAEVLGVVEEDVLFGGLPLFHAFGQTVCMNMVFALGASVALLPAFTPEGAMKTLIEKKVSVCVAVPTMYAALVAYNRLRPHPELKGQVRFGISGGSPLSASTHAAIDEAFAFPIYEGYGLSETSPVVSFNLLKYGLVIGSVGRPIPGVSVSVRDEDGRELGVNEPGQLWVQGDNVMAGFWENPVETEKVFDGSWFATGDIARIDEEGNIYIVDRVKDMILRNGYSIYPREIEDVIYLHPGVHLAAVVGEEKELVGEEVIAYLIPKDAEADQAALVKEVRALVKENLASYKFPRHYRVVSELPLGPTGKILKRML